MVEDRVKERLTGAAILVALVVLLVPEIFGGPGRPAAAPVTRAAEGTPLRSYTIELEPGAAPATASPSSAAPPPVLPTQPALPSAPPAPAAPVSAPAVGRAGGWVVQLGSFSRRENAEKMVQSAAGKGVNLAIAGPDARGLYRVRTAPVAERQRAAALQAELAAQGYVGVINASQ